VYYSVQAGSKLLFVNTSLAEPYHFIAASALTNFLLAYTVQNSKIDSLCCGSGCGTSNERDATPFGSVSAILLNSIAKKHTLRHSL
jgi:hypothetical protein